jgi:dipeptidyl aminopeptidase/acylaminoacyl peptidase
MTEPSSNVGERAGHGLTPDQLVALGRVTAAVEAPCGTWLAVAVSRLDAEGRKYVGELWRVPLAPGAAPVRLTRGVNHDHAPAFRRDGALGFLSNRPSDAPDAGPSSGRDDEPRAQVWILPVEGGEPRPLTDEPLGVTEFRFARDADVLVVIDRKSVV